jgi:hypothetical protein
VISRVQVGCAVLVCFAAPAAVSGQVSGRVSAGTQSGLPTGEAIVALMGQAQAANRVGFLPYTVTRDYQLFEGDASKSHLVVDIQVVPPAFKKYTVNSAAGSAWAERIVRKALDSEVAFAQDSHATDITRENYSFALVGTNKLNGQLCYVLELIPQRKSRNLLRGTIWIDAETHLPRRVEGEPAKDPSWWLTDLRVDLVYGYVGPMWVQTSSKVTANVRIFGRSSMVWQDTSYQLGDLAHGTSLAQTTVPVGVGQR